MHNFVRSTYSVCSEAFREVLIEVNVPKVLHELFRGLL